jgi:hypothetical protein
MGAYPIGFVTNSAQRVSIDTSGNMVVNGAITAGTTVKAGGQILAMASDTAAAPGFTWTGQLGTGMFMPTTQHIAFSTNGNERLRINQTTTTLESYYGLKMGAITGSGSYSATANILPVIGKSGDTNHGISFSSTNVGGTAATGGASTAQGTVYLRSYPGIGTNLVIELGANTDVNNPGVNIRANRNINFDVAQPTQGQVSIGYTYGSNPVAQGIATNWSRLAVNGGLTLYDYGTNSTVNPWSMVSNGGALYFSNDPTTGTSTFTTSNAKAFLDSNGNFTVTGNLIAYYTFSDNRLKANIRPITNALDAVAKISGVRYEPSTVAADIGYEKTGTDIGVLAQDVQKVLPEAVELAPFDRETDGTSKSGENYLMVHYEKLIPLLVEAIKELKAEVNDLRSEINDLKK